MEWPMDHQGVGYLCECGKSYLNKEDQKFCIEHNHKF